MTYQIVLLNGNNISYRVAIIATTTTNWLQEQHCWQQVPRPSYRVARKQRRMARRKWARVPHFITYRIAQWRRRPPMPRCADGSNDRISCHANLSYRVDFILLHAMATATTKWLRQQHLLAAISSSFISCRPKATTNGEEEMSVSTPFPHISHRAMATTSTRFIILYRTVAITTTITIVSISYLLRHAMATATTMAVATTFVIRQPLVYPLRVA